MASPTIQKLVLSYQPRPVKSASSKDSLKETPSALAPGSAEQCTVGWSVSELENQTNDRYGGYMPGRA